jgi:hypothetical protein
MQDATLSADDLAVRDLVIPFYRADEDRLRAWIGQTNVKCGTDFDADEDLAVVVVACLETVLGR